jgi:murein L,D-transpeptidase YcbB/YkuD
VRNLVSSRAGRTSRPAPFFLALSCAAALAASLPSAAHAQAEAPPSLTELSNAIRAEGGKKDIQAFYKARGYRPLWIRNGAIAPEAFTLLGLIENAHLDGLDPGDYRPGALLDAIEDAQQGSAEDLAEAELRLSRAFADYAGAVARTGQVDMLYVDRELAPKPLSRRAALDAAAAAPSLQQFLNGFGWMNPAYGRLRTAFAAHGGRLSEAQRRTLRLNLDRIRALPANPGSRYVLVDAAAARLYLYENGRVKDSMKVVVGKESQQTPMMAAFIRYASLNPYWNVPPDLVGERIAPNVLQDGLSYLKVKGYEVLSDWTNNAKPVDPTLVDWQAVADGRIQPRVRQRPGPANAMGRMKFMFPNELGVYLHDTPDKSLFGNAERMASAGCVRLEDAPRLARWLFGKPVQVKTKAPEQQVHLPKPVPVYITYLTAAPENGRIAFRDDIYGRDGVRLAGR